MRQTHAKVQASLNVENNAENKVLDWTDFDQALPALSASFSSEALADSSITLHVVAYLRHLLETYEDAEFIQYLIAPSPSALTGYFRCSEEEIIDALQELKRQGYEYESSGSTGPIVLWDPLVRTPTARFGESIW